MTPKEQALSMVPEAIKWANAAANALNVILGFNGKRSDIVNLNEFKAQKTHFHIELSPPRRSILRFLRLPFVDSDPTEALLQDVRSRYWDIMRALSQPSIFLDSPATGEGEGATAFVPRNRDGTLRITPYFQAVGPLMQVKTLVHEAAHFLGDAFQDFAYRNRKDDEDKDRYITLPVQYAIRNADSYGYFAFQMAKGVDRILDQDE